MANPEMSDDVEERFQTLESKLVYQEQTIEELNSVVIRQQNQIDALLADVKRLNEGLVEPSPGGGTPGEEPPPPHY